MQKSWWEDNIPECVRGGREGVSAGIEGFFQELRSHVHSHDLEMGLKDIPDTLHRSYPSVSPQKDGQSILGECPRMSARRKTRREGRLDRALRYSTLT